MAALMPAPGNSRLLLSGNEAVARAVWAAIAEGHDAKKTEVAGMAQRGGVVTSHLRWSHCKGAAVVDLNRRAFAAGRAAAAQEAVPA